MLCLPFRTGYVTAALYVTTVLYCRYSVRQKIISCVASDPKIKMTRITKWRTSTTEPEKKALQRVFKVCPIVIYSEVDCLKAPR